MREQEHRYQIYETENGFNVVPIEEDRPIVVCELGKNGFWSFPNSRCYSDGFTRPLYHFWDILTIVVNELYDSWIPPKTSKNEVKESIIRDWCMKATRKSIAKVLRGIWKRKMEILDPEVEELHRLLYAVSNGAGDWYRLAQLLEVFPEEDAYIKRAKRLLKKDLLKYKAARIAFLHNADFESFLQDDGTYDWKMCYSNTENSYTSLNKTLMNLPNGVTYYFLFDLKGIKLPEPVTTRMKLWAYTTMARFNRYTLLSKKKEFMKVIQRSDDDNIRAAIRYIWKYYPTPSTGDFRRSKAIIHALQMIFDYPLDIGEWDMLGLAKRSEKHHHEEEQRLAQRREEEHKEWLKRNKDLVESKTALPPIPLPENENIKFLDKYKDVLEEGHIMLHCIGSYAPRAVAGGSYLFHVDYRGEMASVEVSPLGYVCQSYGPKDTVNNASKYGERELKKWAKQLTECNKSPIIRGSKEYLSMGFTPTPFAEEEEIPF